jgi:type IV fimbrial biogenesis protein FimT
MARPVQGGVTLIELMVAVLLTALVLALGVPGYQTLIGNAQRSSVLTEISASLMYARAEAIRRAAPVSLCAGDQEHGCDTGHPSDWSRGWILFLDASGNRRLDGGDEILRVHRFKAPRYRLQAAQGLERGLTFRASGFAHRAGVLIYCEPGSGRGHRLALSASGSLQVRDLPDCS